MADFCMADFCHECSIEIFGEDFGDLAGLVTEQQVVQGLRAEVLCEGCGPILVDHRGVCQGDCMNPAHVRKPPQLTPKLQGFKR
jgi:hypothetical protein